jgi:hypothetical protein
MGQAVDRSGWDDRQGCSSVATPLLFSFPSLLFSLPMSTEHTFGMIFINFISVYTSLVSSLPPLTTSCQFKHAVLEQSNLLRVVCPISTVPNNPRWPPLDSYQGPTSIALAIKIPSNNAALDLCTARSSGSSTDLTLPRGALFDSPVVAHDNHPALSCTIPVWLKYVHARSTGQTRRLAAASADRLPFRAGSRPAEKNMDRRSGSLERPMGLISRNDHH